MATIESFSFYLAGIEIDGVTYPVPVAKIKFDTTLKPNVNYDVKIPSEFRWALEDYLRTKPSIVGVTYGSDSKLQEFFSEAASFKEIGDDTGYKIIRSYRYDLGIILTIHYKGKPLSATAPIAISEVNNDKVKIALSLIPVDADSGEILYNGNTSSQTWYGCVSKAIPSVDGIPPFGIGFTSTKIPYGIFEGDLDSDYYEYNASFRRLGEKAPDPSDPIPPSPPYTPVNPYGPGGFSGPTQTDNPDEPGYLPPGTFDDKSDPIPDSPLPTVSAANTGFTRIYNPTLAQVQDLARYLWTDDTVVQTIWNKIKQFFEDPMQAIIGFNLVPVPVPNGGVQNFSLMFIDTGVSMNVAASQFVDVDCGTVQLERYYGSALDQSPYTKISCFLPYIGTVHLNTDEVMGTTLQVKYRVDIVSGSCVAKILVDGNVLYQYSGHCAITIPFASADFSNYVSAAISVAKLGIGLGVAAATGIPLMTGGIDPAQQTNQVVTTTTTEAETVRNPTTGRQITSGTRTSVQTVESSKPSDSTKASYGYLTPENISNTVGQIMGSKPTVQHTGSFSGNTGYLGVRRPFLIIERPNMCLPESYQHLNGYPSMITMELSTCKGFTKIQQVELTGMTATNPEQAEILGLLKSGVFFDV